MNESEKNLLRMNFKLALEVDTLGANLDYLRNMAVIMTRLMSEHNVPYPAEEIQKLEDELSARIENINQYAETILRVQDAVFGEKSAGMRTGSNFGKPVTDADLENILGQIDPDIVKKMGE